MAMREEFERSGQWLFKRRSYLPIFLIVISLIAIWQNAKLGFNTDSDVIWEIAGLCVSFFGLAIRIFTIGYVPKNTSGRNTHGQVADSLNTTGIYSMVRHPLYVGNFFMWLGIAIFPHTLWLALVCVFIFWIYYERIMFAEEEFLRKIYGDVYTEWAKTVPAFIPRFSNYVKPNRKFSLKKVLRQEPDGFFNTILVLNIFVVCGDLMEDLKFEPEPFWLILLGIGLVTYVSLKFLKKKTNILN